MSHEKDRATTLVRACMPDFGDLMNYDESEGKFHGILAEGVNPVIEVARTLMNFTIVSTPDANYVKNETTGEFGGCIGMIQKRQAEFALVGAFYPTLGPNFTQISTAAISNEIILMAPYRTTQLINSVVEPDMLVTITAILSLEAVALTTVYVILFSILVGWANSMEKRFNSSSFESNSGTLYQVLSHFIQQQSADYSSPSLRSLSLYMSLFSFFMVSIICNLVTTDKISILNAPANDTYEKILANKDVQPWWWAMMNDFEAYKFSKPSKTKNGPREIWEHSKAISKRQSAANSTAIGPLIAVNLKNMWPLYNLAYEQKMVWLMSSAISGLFNDLQCNVWQGTDRSDFRFIAKVDRNVGQRLIALPITDANEYLRAATAKFSLRFIEHRLYLNPENANRFRESVSKFYQGRGLKYSKHFMSCSDMFHMEQEYPELAALTPLSLVLTFVFLSSSCTFAYLVYLVETRISRSKLRRLKGKPLAKEGKRTKRKYSLPFPSPYALPLKGRSRTFRNRPMTFGTRIGSVAE